MLRITPRGYNEFTGSHIEIPFSSVKSYTDLKKNLLDHHGLTNGYLTINNNSFTLAKYFNYRHFLKENEKLDIVYINSDYAVNLEFTLLYGGGVLTYHIDDTISLSDLTFCDPKVKYMFIYNCNINNVIDIEKKVSEIIGYDPNKPKIKSEYTIHVYASSY